MSELAVRDLVPVDRISTARIRQFLRKDEALGRWSRAGAGAIRPTLLASLVRDCIWEALDIPFEEVRSRLKKPASETSYGITIEVETGPNGHCVEFEIRACFTRRPSTRIAARIELCATGSPIPLSASPILLVAA